MNAWRPHSSWSLVLFWCSTEGLAVVSRFFSYSPLTNPNTVNSSPTKITKKIIAKISHCLLWRNNRPMVLNLWAMAHWWAMGAFWGGPQRYLKNFSICRKISLQCLSVEHATSIWAVCANLTINAKGGLMVDSLIHCRFLRITLFDIDSSLWW